MPKIPLNGFVVDVSNVQFVGANGTPKQEIVLRVPAYRDEFGEQKSPDDHWRIAILGERIDKFNLHQRHIGSRVKTEVFINSREYVSKKDSSTGYMVNVSLASIEFVAASANNHQKATAAQPDAVLNEPVYQANRAGEEEDLPF